MHVLGGLWHVLDSKVSTALYILWEEHGAKVMALTIHTALPMKPCRRSEIFAGRYGTILVRIMYIINTVPYKLTLSLDEFRKKKFPDISRLYL